MTEDVIQNTLFKHLQAQGCFIVPNIFLYAWESDLLKTTASGFTHEYEIKRSISDFRADFKKVSKHRTLQRAANCSNYFWYVCVDGLIPEEEVPKYAGLIYLKETKLRLIKRVGHKRCDREKYELMVIKPAPKLHNRKILPKNIEYITRGLMLRYWSSRI